MKIKPERILLIQFRQIGDVLLTTPIITVLRKYYPKSYIAFLTERTPSELLEDNPYLNEIIIFDRKEKRSFVQFIQYCLSVLKLYYTVRKKRFDTVIDFIGNPGSACVTLFSGARYRIGFTIRVRKYAYNIKATQNIEPEYVVLKKFAALKCIGINTIDTELTVRVPDYVDKKITQFFHTANITSHDFVVTLSPTSIMPARRWTQHGFARLAELLINKYSAKVIFLWGPGELSYVEQIVEQTGTPVPPIISFPTNLKELAGIITRAHLLITNDNGTKHVAVAVGTPTITIYGPTDYRIWNPPDSKLHRVIHADVDCVGCQLKRCEKMICMESLTPQDIEKLVLEMKDVIHPLNKKL